MSGIDANLSRLVLDIGDLGCIFLNCHVNREKRAIEGPTYKEYVQAQVYNVPGPSMVSFTGSLAAKLLSNANLETGESINIIKQIATASTRGERIQGGFTILGSFPEYINMGKLDGMVYFNLDSEVWKTIQNAGDNYLWAINKQFLDDSIAAGNSFVITMGENKEVGEGLLREIQYLLDQGYQWVEGVLVKK